MSWGGGWGAGWGAGIDGDGDGVGPWGVAVMCRVIGWGGQEARGRYCDM